MLTWRQTYTDHPAAGGLLAELLAAQRGTAWPAHIALLLPLSSPQRAAALAVRDGFMAAHLRGPHGAGTTVRVYDTAQGSQQAYLKAQLDGADFIVGPLLKPEVDQVIAQAGFVPTLALNFATKDGTFLRSFYQFALAPEDEARTIAATAAAAGAKTALAFVPSNARGYQIRDTFRAEFEARGGQLVDCERLRPVVAGFLAADRCAAEHHAQQSALPAARRESRRAGAVRAAAPPRHRHDLHRRPTRARLDCSCRSCDSTPRATFRRTRRPTSSTRPTRGAAPT